MTENMDKVGGEGTGTFAKQVIDLYTPKKLPLRNEIPRRRFMFILRPENDYRYRIPLGAAYTTYIDKNIMMVGGATWMLLY
ncbi:MAG: hypothetical protein E7453_02935 [Ruminococcaceae bacterium]|nr:hypothetical protein [Oscillospiraceae bacterium]